MRYLKKISIFIAIVYLAFFLYGMLNRARPADLVVVLGNTVLPDGTPSKRLRARLDESYAAAIKNPSSYIMVSGAIGVEGFPEGDSMKSYLVSLGLSSEKIIVDNIGYTTRDTVIHTVREMQQRNMDSVIFVSQYFHKPRIQIFAAREGIESAGFSSPIYIAFRDMYSVPREIVAILAEILYPASK
jgi:vancomycin permeability regulator SanA